MDGLVVREKGGSKSSLPSGQVNNNGTHRPTGAATVTLAGNDKTNKVTANGVISRPAGQPPGNARNQVARAGPSKSVQSSTISSMNHQPARTTTLAAPSKKTDKPNDAVNEKKRIPPALPRRITRTATLAAAGDKTTGILPKGTTGIANGIARGGVAKSASHPVQITGALKITRVASATLAARVKSNRPDVKVPIKRPGQPEGSTATNGTVRGVMVGGGAKSIPSVPINGPSHRTARTTTTTSLVADKKLTRVDPTKLNRPGQLNGTTKARITACGGGGPSKASVQTGKLNGGHRPAVPLISIHTDGANLVGMNGPQNSVQDFPSNPEVSLIEVIPSEVPVLGDDSNAGIAPRVDESSVTIPDAVDVSCLSKSSERIFVPERSKEEHLKYFRDLIADEKRYLSTMADKWDIILEKAIGSDSSQSDISEEGIDLIRLSIGQSRLFMSKKLQQFVGLVDDCEFERGEKIVSPTDLAGFWEMINMQVINIHDKFDKVETLAANNWAAPEVLSINTVDGGKTAGAPAKRALKPINRKSRPVVQGKSNIREMIERARREKAAQLGPLDVPEGQDMAPALA